MLHNPQLDTFIRVADAGSFSKAADEAYITPTAAIKQINTLEADLNVQLFIRTHRGVTLTDVGKIFYKDAKHIIQYSGDSILRARNAIHDASDVIRIGISPKNPGQFLVELWPRLHEQYPDAKYQMVTFENTPEKAKDLLGNLGRDIDILIGPFDDGFLQTRGCAALEFSKEPILCAVPVHHRLASMEKLAVEDLYGESLMLIQRGWNSYMDVLRDHLQQQYNKINVVDFDFYDMGVFNDCVSKNCIIITVDLWKNIHPMLTVIPVEWEYIIPVGLLHSPIPTSTVQKFLDAVRTVLSL